VFVLDLLNQTCHLLLSWKLGGTQTHSLQKDIFIFIWVSSLTIFDSPWPMRDHKTQVNEGKSLNMN
jgi:hypothetical protein